MSARIIAIIIACMGLFGVVTFSTARRTKEIGIRKVLGATVRNIMMMFTKESATLIVIAFAAAAPLGSVLGKVMLSELPERVKPGVGIFLFTLLGSLAVALLTVAYQSFLAAVQNPVESLRQQT